MRHYELSYLISTKLSQEDAEELIEDITTYIQDEGLLDFTPESQKKPERISLAYSIEEHNEAYLSTLHFFLKPEKVQQIKSFLKEKEEIIRFVVFKKDSSKKKPKKKRERKETSTEESSSSNKKEEREDKKRKKVDLDEVEEKLDQILE